MNSSVKIDETSRFNALTRRSTHDFVIVIRIARGKRRATRLNKRQRTSVAKKTISERNVADGSIVTANDL